MTIPTISPRDFQPANWRGLTAGLDRWYWTACTREGELVEQALEARRNAAIAAKVGGTFEECEQQGRAGEYLDAMNELPSPQDWLNEALGEPNALFGPIPGWQGDSHAARIKWKAICAQMPVVGEAA